VIAGSKLRRGSTADGNVMLPMRICLATAENLDAVLGLIDDAAAWLRTKDTDQWARPWPDTVRRDARVLRGLVGRKTWIVWDGNTPAATVTLATKPNPRVWARSTSEYDLAEPAVYVHRLITARSHADWGLGAQLIDWAGRRASREYGAEWIRIDVWATNTALHSYYTKRGFRPCGFCPDPTYPSGALFQKPVALIEANHAPPFTESRTCPGPADSVKELVLA
jgi:GNAT superfamily N-acetyltransferase